MSFERYMQLALYHDNLGYYTRGEQNIGKEGDFITSVSVGHSFGTILAHRIHDYWQKLNKPAGFHLIELAANNGQLSFDILSETERSFPDLYHTLSYHICEHLPVMMRTQAEKLAKFPGKLEQHTHLDQLRNRELTGIILSNELIDAMPVRLIQKQEDTWIELKVDSDGDLFSFIAKPIGDQELLQFINRLPQDLPAGYTTEYRPGLKGFCEALSGILNEGMVITIDYGYTHQTFYAPHRITGTLRTYRGHQAGEAPLEDPGQMDITAHVDFTQLAEAFISAGFGLTDFVPQTSYLTNHGRQWLQGLEDAPIEARQKSIRQFQTLTHPSMMGRQFLVMECEKGKPHSVRSLDLAEIEQFL